ncbi:GNAT family N-acetyltransferase [Larkinella rosea]|uniref:N-acetyltransferase n=1 Tax=Larkinella rosea TaxID=2025312 RepID=A0A3P1BS50_9BACT|nr:GNAT family N-acetyltransferase [Larkinella rosea]RRB03922.1 N-acetyltransferase [Larkinella rosea]
MVSDASTPEQLLDENFNRHVRFFPSQTAGMDVRVMNDILVVNSQLASDTFNIVHIPNASRPGLADLKTVVDYTVHSGLPFCFWLSETAATETTVANLRQLGAACVGQDPGMILSLDAYIPIDNEHQDEIRIVKNRKELADFATVIAQNWKPADENVLRYYQNVAPVLLAAPDTVLMVCYRNSQPVSVIELFPTNNQIIGIYSLATLREFRGQGIGTVLMRHALNYAKQTGYKTALLQSSEDGFRIYQKFGYRVVTMYYEYQLVGSAAAN